MVGVDYSSL